MKSPEPDTLSSEATSVGLLLEDLAQQMESRQTAKLANEDTPTGNLVTLTGSLVTPTGSLVTSSGSLVTSSGSLVTPTGSLVTPTGSAADRPSVLLTPESFLSNTPK